jgi:hypothetical protein
MRACERAWVELAEIQIGQRSTVLAEKDKKEKRKETTGNRFQKVFRAHLEEEGHDR